MFPQGGPGVALLLLRISVVAFLIIVAVNYSGPYYQVILGAILLISVSLLIGFGTPFFCAMAVVLLIGKLIINPQTSSLVCIIAIANAVALALLGPGAYSLDSKLFGRRVTTFRPGNGINNLL
jgi:uncharacterized membrane protein YphA (DoxX/SURF4 family)